MNVWTGDLGLDDGVPQSVYLLKTDEATPVEDADGKQLRIDLRVGETAELPDGLGTVTFDDVTPWVRVQISQSPGKRIALRGVVLALDRPARLAVHPPPPGVGAGAPCGP